MSDDELLAALIEDPDALDEAGWSRARTLAAADPARLRRHLVLDELLGRALDPMRADLPAAIRHRIEHRVASGRFASAVMRRRRPRTRGWQRKTLPIAALVAILVLLVGLWRWSLPSGAGTMVAVAPIATIEVGEGLVRRGERSESSRPPAALQVGDVLTANTNGTTIRYVDGTTLALAAGTRLRLAAAVNGLGKRAELADGHLMAQVAPQPVGQPLVIATPQAEVTVIGTAFALTCDQDRTRLSVTRGRVRVARLADRAVTDVAAGEYAIAAAGVELRALPTTPAPLRLELDFEDGHVQSGTVGTVVTGPERPGNRKCLAARDIAEAMTTRVMLIDNQDGLFTYRAGAELSFDYWADERAGALTVYLWNRTQQLSMGNLELYPPELVRQRWSRATVDLATFSTGKARLQAGDLVTEITIQTGAGFSPLFIDNVRVTERPPP